LLIASYGMSAAMPFVSTPTVQAAKGSVFVCKYSSTPIENEVARTVNNPARNDYNVGDTFVDAQGLSYVFAIDVGQPKPSTTDCPRVTMLPAKPTVTDPCGLNNATWNKPADTATVHWTISASGHLIASTIGNYIFSDGTKTHDYGVAKDSGTLCTSVVVPAKPTVTDPCGLNNATWNVPADTASVAWSVDANGNLIATAKTGFIFADNTYTHNYGIAVDSGEKCKIAVPATPSVNDPCGANNATWNVPADTAEVTWSINADGNLVASTTANYVFADGTTSHTFVKPADAGDCKVPVPATPTITDPCGLNNATWDVPTNSGHITWSVNASNELVATTDTGYVFTDGKTSHNYGQATDSGNLCETPLPPTPQTYDPCGLNNATWIVPDNTAEVTWTLTNNGHLVAHTTANYQFPGGAVTKDYGVALDSGKKCLITEVTPPTATDVCGTAFDKLTYANGANYTWQLTGSVALGTAKLTAVSTNSNYEFAAGVKTVYDFTFTNEACVLTGKWLDCSSFSLTIDSNLPEDTGVSVVLYDADGNALDFGVGYTDYEIGDDGFTLTLNGIDSQLVRDIKYFYIFPDQSTSDVQSSEVAYDCWAESVTPVAPTATVACGPNNDVVVLPEVRGVRYTLGGWVNGKQTVTATAENGFMFPEGVQTEWVLSDGNTSCGQVLGETTTTPSIPSPIKSAMAVQKLENTGTSIWPISIVSMIVTMLAVATALQRRRCAQE